MLRRNFLKLIGCLPFLKGIPKRKKWFTSQHSICIVGDRSGFWFFSNRHWPVINIKSDRSMQIYFEGSDLLGNFKEAKRLTETQTIEADTMYQYKIRPDWPGYIRIKSTYDCYNAFLTDGENEKIINWRNNQ